MDEKAYWVGFNHIKGIGAVRLTALISHFGSAQAAWGAPASQLAQAGVGSKLAERVAQLRASLDLPKIIEQIESKGIRVLTLGSEDYPQQLAEVDQPPPVLYVRGTFTAEDLWAVAIVGTRAVTAYGNQITHELATVLPWSAAWRGVWIRWRIRQPLRRAGAAWLSLAAAWTASTRRRTANWQKN
jgi:DNA processing protein